MVPALIEYQIQPEFRKKSSCFHHCKAIICSFYINKTGFIKAGFMDRP
jgi:hypothetical protein